MLNSEYNNLSAKGAKYESQGQALSGAKRVAPGLPELLMEALKVRNIVLRIPLFQSFTSILNFSQGRRASLRSALAPGYHISRLWRCADQIGPPLRRFLASAASGDFG